jgi:hypothetical protein
MRCFGILARITWFVALVSMSCLLGGCISTAHFLKEDLKEGFSWKAIKSAPIYTPFGTFNTGKKAEANPDC